MMYRVGRRVVIGAALLLSCVWTAGGQSAGDRVGVYIWGQLPKEKEPLAAAVEDVKRLGVKVARVTVAPYWDPRGEDPERFAPVDKKIARGDYAQVFDAFPVVLITAYDMASYEAKYRKRGDEASWKKMLAEVREEYRRLAIELSKRENEFVVLNWEAEHDAAPEGWKDYLEYVQARLDGIAQGRDEAREMGYPARVSSGFEFVYVEPSWHVFPDGKRLMPSGLETAASLKNLGYVSYSAWEAINYALPETTVPQFRAAFGKIKAAAEKSERPFGLIVGEVGYLRNWDDGSTRIEQILNECLKSGAKYVINWLAYDQPGQLDVGGLGVEQSQFGKFSIGREITSQGEFLRDYLTRDDESGFGVKPEKKRAPATKKSGKPAPR